VLLASGESTETSSGNIYLSTANSGSKGVSGAILLRTGSSSKGNSGMLILSTGASTSGHGRDIELLANNHGAGGDILLSVGL
jgi:hypothetical protein